MEGQARCNCVSSNAAGIHEMCGREAFALVPARDREGRSVGGLQVCWHHLFEVLRQQAEARSK